MSYNLVLFEISQYFIFLEVQMMFLKIVRVQKSLTGIFIVIHCYNLY